MVHGLQPLGAIRTDAWQTSVLSPAASCPAPAGVQTSPHVGWPVQISGIAWRGVTYRHLGDAKHDRRVLYRRLMTASGRSGRALSSTEVDVGTRRWRRQALEFEAERKPAGGVEHQGSSGDVLVDGDRVTKETVEDARA